MAETTIERDADRRDGDVVSLSSLRRLMAQADAVGGGGEPSRLERSLTIAGTVALPLGLVLIGFGWYGAAHTPYVFEQVPYLVSGGLLGLALTIVGGMLYFGSWLAGMARREQRDAEELRAVLVDLREQFERAAGASSVVDGSAADDRANGRRLLATPTGSMLHDPDCRVVADRDDLREVAADEPGFSACKMCEPLEA